MPAFSGKYYYNLDQKGRLIIPAPFREIISAKYSPKLFITSAAFDKCLLIYPFEEWNALQEKVRTLPQMDDAVTYFKRKVIASAIEVDLDRQGRVLVPQAHREDSGIANEAVIVGMIDKIELWDKSAWEGVTDPSKLDIGEFKRTLSGLGL